METKEYAAALLLERLVLDAYSDRQPSVMNPLQWSIVRHLWSVGGKAVDVSSLAQYLGRFGAPICEAVTTLEQRGLIARGFSHGSASEEIRLTDAGLRTLEGDPMLRFSQMISALEEPHRNVFLIAVRAIALVRTS